MARPEVTGKKVGRRFLNYHDSRESDPATGKKVGERSLDYRALKESDPVASKKTGRRLLDYQALKERGIPWTRVHLARLEAAGKFPMHINVGEASIAWFEDEVDDFLEMKAAERDAKAAARAKPQARKVKAGTGEEQYG